MIGASEVPGGARRGYGCTSDRGITSRCAYDELDAEVTNRVADARNVIALGSEGSQGIEGNETGIDTDISEIETGEICVSPMFKSTCTEECDASRTYRPPPSIAMLHFKHSIRKLLQLASLRLERRLDLLEQFWSEPVGSSGIDIDPRGSEQGGREVGDGPLGFRVEAYNLPS